MARPDEFWTLMTIGALRLGVPQRDVRTLEPVLDLRVQPGNLDIGHMDLEGLAAPVFCLSAALAPCAVLAAAHRVCVMLSAHGRAFGLTCERVVNAPAAEVRRTALPRAMAAEGSPIHSLAVHENGVACLTSAAALYAMLVREGWRPELQMAAA
jgi:hypothetical protein